MYILVSLHPVRTALLMVGLTLWLTACDGGKSATDTIPQAAVSAGTSGGTAHSGKVLHLFIFSDYLGPHTLADFEQQTGIKVSVAYYDNNETLETRLLAGHSGFDIVVPTAPFYQRQIKAGVYLSLDKSRLPNLHHLDPRLMAKAAAYDPENAHGIIYMWGTDGIGYNARKLKALMPEVPLDSWRLVFDPTVAAKIAPCGISVLDAPAEIMRAVLPYLGRDANSQKAEDLAAAEATLMKIRPFIRSIDSAPYVDALANGDLCVSVGFNGALLQARDRARDAQKGVAIDYVVPKEGSVLWFDMMAIPKDAPDLDSAYAFMNFVMTPKVIAEVSNSMRFANANAAAVPLLDPSVRGDPGIYPPPELRQQLAPFLGDTPEQTRAITRMWQRFKTGQ